MCSPVSGWPTSVYCEATWGKRAIAELPQHELSQRGLDTSGKKEDMVKRLQENDNDSMTGKRSNIAERAGQSPAHKEARTASAN